jgi:hypothetical protein
MGAEATEEEVTWVAAVVATWVAADIWVVSPGVTWVAFPGVTWAASREVVCRVAEDFQLPPCEVIPGSPAVRRISQIATLAAPASGEWVPVQSLRIAEARLPPTLPIETLAEWATHA